MSAQNVIWRCQNCGGLFRAADSCSCDRPKWEQPLTQADLMGAGYRILAPGEMTPEEDAFEKVAQWHDKNARYCLEASKDEPRLNEDDRRRAREAAKHHAASAAAIRNKMAGERRSASIRALKASPVETDGGE